LPWTSRYCNWPPGTAGSSSASSRPHGASMLGLGVALVNGGVRPPR
jgi:hypothetical protein